MHKLKAAICDIFSSVQGEGIFLGARQIFVRFNDCNLNCSYCDEPREPKSREYTADELFGQVKFLELSKGPHHSVSLTGGEPLLYADFLKVFLGLLKKEKIKSYLETNGTLPQELSKVIDLVDIVAMDIKLPSSTGQAEFWKQHLEFARIAASKKLFIKAVITDRTTREDVEMAVDIVKKVKANAPLVLQPASPAAEGARTIDNEKLMKLMEIGLKKQLENIRVIPQMHKMLGIK